MNRQYARENRLPPEQEGKSRRLMPAAVLSILFVGFLAASYDGLNSSSSATFASNPQAQLAQSATAITKPCEAGYDYTLALNDDGSTKVISQRVVDCKAKYTGGTPAATTTVSYFLSCQTLGGQTKSASTTITIAP